MVLEFIDKNYTNGEPIFLDEIPCSSKDALRQEMKKLTDQGKLVRFYNGVYFKSYKTIFGTDGKLDINKYIEKKFLYNNGSPQGYIKGIGLYNRYGFTSQVASVIEVVSNSATTTQRKMDVGGNQILIYKPLVDIDKQNINEMEFLELMTNIDIYSELKDKELKTKINEYITKKKINFKIVKKLLMLFPLKVYKNLFQNNLMDLTV